MSYKKDGKFIAACFLTCKSFDVDHTQSQECNIHILKMQLDVAVSPPANDLQMNILRIHSGQAGTAAILQMDKGNYFLVWMLVKRQTD